jgi:hypothetical protein
VRRDSRKTNIEGSYYKKMPKSARTKRFMPARQSVQKNKTTLISNEGKVTILLKSGRAFDFQIKNQGTVETDDTVLKECPVTILNRYFNIKILAQDYTISDIKWIYSSINRYQRARIEIESAAKIIIEIKEKSPAYNIRIDAIDDESKTFHVPALEFLTIFIDEKTKHIEISQSADDSDCSEYECGSESEDEDEYDDDDEYAELISDSSQESSDTE